MEKIQAKSIIEQITSNYNSIFEFIGFNMLKINSDMDRFTIKFGKINDFSFQIKLESLIIGSLELFSSIFFQSREFYQSTQSYLNLKQMPINSIEFLIEIDILNTIEDVYYFEVYCYDENEILVAKGSSIIIKI